MFQLFMSVVGGVEIGSGSDITADWDNLSCGDGSGAPDEDIGNTVVLTFSGTDPRQLQFLTEGTGTIYYKKNSSSYLAFSSGILVSVTTTDEITFKYGSSNRSKEKSVAVWDYTMNELIDSFNCTFVGNDEGGPGSPP